MLWAPILNQVSIRKTLPQRKALNHSTRRRSLNLICFSVNRRSLTSTHPYHSVGWNVYTSEQTSTSALVGDSAISTDCKTVRIFAYSSTREQSKKVWNEAENRERDWGETLKDAFFSRLTRPHTPFARVRLLRHALPITLLILRKNTDCFAVYHF